MVKQKLRLCVKMSWHFTLSRHKWTTLKKMICTTQWQWMHQTKVRPSVFPTVLQYFHFEEGIQHVLLDFYSDSNESSEAVTNQLLDKLKMLGLDFGKMLAYAADNASVNYRKHNSVYQKLKLAQKDVLAANCLAHILHNATRYAAGSWDVEIENVVLKVYSHFSISASINAQLKEFC